MAYAKHYITCIVSAETPEEIMDHVKCTDYNTTKDWYARFFKKEHLPKRYHYAYNDRIEEVIVDVEKAWEVARYVNMSSSFSTSQSKVHLKK